ncbi:SCP-2 sterol transfer family protein [Haloarcula vallismortis]|uniref:Sterol carrier protein n=2 Tax=Haloarcula vallismortis TaxID=28442 RepID=M0JLM0_HALVA|nr:SCP2 sterol-binding domain-containing protein [Haloarcula vallismortis]EMA09248.1 sterol carrier protein [Haloarcula vallismortis ATCC 29715]SDW28258.1 SCP-2 sterol transfer family protein [Haloarcula vallismortis]
MTVTLPTEADDWAAAWRDRINDRSEFADSADDFTAVFCFEIRADDAYTGESIQFVVVIKDGVCTAAGTVADPEYDFAFRGPYSRWVTMLQGDLDISAAAMDGTFEVEGDTMRLLRRQDTIAEMVAAAQNVDTEFEY